MNKEAARRAALHGRTLARVTALRETIAQLEAVLVSQRGALPGTDAFALQNDLVMANRFFQEWTLVLAETGPVRLLHGELKDAAQADWRGALRVLERPCVRHRRADGRTHPSLPSRRRTGLLR